MLKSDPQDFPGCPVVKTSPSNTGSAGSFPGQGTKTLHALRPKNQNIKQKQLKRKKKESDPQIRTCSVTPLGVLKMQSPWAHWETYSEFALELKSLVMSKHSEVEEVLM